MYSIQVFSSIVIVETFINPPNARARWQLDGEVTYCMFLPREASYLQGA